MNWRLVVSLVLAAATLAIYARTAHFDFVNFDDPEYVKDNPHVLGGLGRDAIAWAFTTGSQANWHPLTWISLQADAALQGPAARGFHATNVVLHVASVVLLFFLFHRMTGCVWRSALVAGLFALHPLHVESVAWIAERKDVLSTAFGLLALHAWLSSLSRRSVAFHALALLAYAASLMAKPMLVTLPILLLLLDVWPLRRDETWSRLIAEKIPWFALAAGSSIVTFLVQAHGGATRSMVQYPIALRVENAIVSAATYLVKAVWPTGLAVYYPYPYEGIPIWKAAGAALLLATVTAACITLRRSRPQLLVGWLWYLVTLAPVIGVIQVGSQAMADRYTYVPLIGPFAMLAFTLPEIGVRAKVGRASAFNAVRAALLAGVVVLAALAWRQVGTWRDTTTLFEHALAVTSDNAVAHNQLARALFEHGQIDLAVTHCQEAVRIAPDMADAQSNLVRGLLAQGKNDEAAAAARDELRLHPDDSRSHVNAGLIARVEGRPDDALASFEQALRLNPSDPEAHLNLGALLNVMGKRDEAIAQFEEAVRLRPNDARAQRALERIRGER